eukprot:947894-Pelagomonas_calceolata.AAC.2
MSALKVGCGTIAPHQGSAQLACQLSVQDDGRAALELSRGAITPAHHLLQLLRRHGGCWVCWLSSG